MLRRLPETGLRENLMPQDPEGMEPQSFIIKIWVEEAAGEAGHAMWRGHITHVPSNTRRYVQDLNEIFLFLAKHLEPLGIKLEKRWRPSLGKRQVTTQGLKDHRA
jgi:hypothetical protein